MDILLDEKGDIFISPDCDIVLTNSVAQKISIRLQWFLGEWRWNIEEGLPWFSDFFGVKSPDIDNFNALIREKIFEVDEITDVISVFTEYDPSTRIGVIKYVAKTDEETIKEEVNIRCQIMA